MSSAISGEARPARFQAVEEGVPPAMSLCQEDCGATAMVDREATRLVIVLLPIESGDRGNVLPTEGHSINAVEGKQLVAIDGYQASKHASIKRLAFREDITQRCNNRCFGTGSILKAYLQIVAVLGEKEKRQAIFIGKKCVCAEAPLLPLAMEASVMITEVAFDAIMTSGMQMPIRLPASVPTEPSKDHRHSDGPNAEAISLRSV